MTLKLLLLLPSSCTSWLAVHTLVIPLKKTHFPVGNISDVTLKGHFSVASHLTGMKLTN